MNYPTNYPHTANSAIADARAFSIGNSTTIHQPDHFPDGNKIVAVCGQYAWATQTDQRQAYWRNSHPNCPNCQPK